MLSNKVNLKTHFGLCAEHIVFGIYLFCITRPIYRL